MPWVQDENGEWQWQGASVSAGEVGNWNRAASGSYRPRVSAPEVAQWNQAAPARPSIGGLAGGDLSPYYNLTRPGAQTAVAQPPATGRGRPGIAQRFDALVRAGIIDPRNILDATGRVRPEIMAQLNDAGAYRGAGDYGYGGGVELTNPDEIRADEWARDFGAKREGENVLRSGMYYDPERGTYNVTAARADQLLDRFGTARVAEDRYRQQLQAGNVNAMQAQGRIADLEQQRNAAAARIPYGQTNIGYENQIAGYNRQIQDATMAYNRARGAARAPVQPITPTQMAQGMTPEQFSAMAQGVAQGYTNEEMEDLYQGRIPGAQNQARYAPYFDYRRAAAARGVGF